VDEIAGISETKLAPAPECLLAVAIVMPLNISAAVPAASGGLLVRRKPATATFTLVPEARAFFYRFNSKFEIVIFWPFDLVIFV